MSALGGALIVAVRTVSAQTQPVKVHRIGFLGTTSAAEFASRLDAFRTGLHDAGYREGRNTVIEFRWADGHVDRLPQLAAELVALKVDVLVTHAEGALAAKRATTTIPIVMAFSADAVATGLARSLARPGGNVTGSTVLIPEISAKRLELLKTAAPRATRVGVLVRKGGTWKTVLDMLQDKGKSLNLTVQFFEIVRDKSELESTFSEMAKARINALAVSEDPLLAGYRNK